MFCQRCHSQPAVGFFDSDGLWAEKLEEVEELPEGETCYCHGCAEFEMAMAAERLKDATEGEL